MTLPSVLRGLPPSGKIFLGIALLWLVYYIVAVLCRPLFPIDETRYMGVAWEMQVNGQWILPTINFGPYHHKPPLLFWLINMMWEVFGVSRWAATLVPLLLSLLCGLGAFALTRSLEPQDARPAHAAPLLLLFGLPMLVYGTIIMFDVLLAACVTGAMAATILYARTGLARYVLLFGLAAGLGVLAKGPVVALHVVFPWLLAPLWAAGLPGYERGRGRWYMLLAGGLLVATAVGLAWAIPAALMGGEKYSRMIFWGQTAGRMVKAFDHQHPFWWYLPYLPLMAVPWIFTPWFWRAARRARQALPDWRVRFLLCWIVPVFLCFCAISGKQVHYLVPLLPGLAALLALLLARLPEFSPEKLWRAALPMFAALCLFQIVGAFTYFKNYDVRPIVQAWEPYRDRPLAFVRNYEDQVSFDARLTRPVASLEIEQLHGWFDAHPDGVAFVRYSRGQEDHVHRYQVVTSSPYKGSRVIALVKRKDDGR